MDDVVRRFVERAERLRQERAAELSARDLEAIALELGMSEGDLTALRAEVDEHLTRARGYVEHELWDDAIGELAQIVDLTPGRADVLYTVALANAGRHRSTGDDGARRSAAAAARGCLQIDPSHRPSFELLRELEREPAPSAWLKPLAAAAAVAGTGAASAWAFLGGTPALLPALGGTALFAGAAAFAALRLGRPRARPDRAFPQSPKAAPEGSRTPPAPEPRSERPLAGKAGRPTPEVNLPVALATDPKGVAVWLRKSVLTRYPERSFHGFVLELDNCGDLQIEELELDLVYFDDAGNELRRATDRVLSSTHHAPLRPGDCHVSFSREVFDEPLVPTRLVLRPGAMELKNAPASPPPARPHAFEWRSGALAGVMIALRQRSGHDDGSASEGDWLEAIWEIENTGTLPLFDLTLEVERLSAEGAVLETQSCMVTYEDRVLYPGEIRLERWLFQATKPGWSFRAAVR
jgi:hypothetical protein